MKPFLHPFEEFARNLAEGWRREARLLERRGLKEPAGLMGSFADDLESAVEKWLDEPLNLADAAMLTGQGYSTLQAQVRAGRVPDAGEKGRPRVKRRDLRLQGESPRGTALRSQKRDPGEELIELKLRGME